MAQSSKSQKSKKSRVRKYVYTVPEKGVLYTALGDPIILDGRNKYVCGACFLLLKNMDARSWLLSPLLGMRRTPPMQTILSARSRCDCELSILTPTLSLFPSSLREGESTSMVCFLMCRCVSEIRAKVDGLFRTVKKESQEHSLDFGERVTWTRSKLTALESWRT